MNTYFYNAFHNKPRQISETDGNIWLTIKSLTRSITFHTKIVYPLQYLEIVVFSACGKLNVQDRY